MSILRLKQLLKEKGITGKGLSEKVNVTQATISNISNGNHFPKPDLLINIAKTLDVDIRELFISTKDNTTETIYVNRDGVYVPIGELKV